ncbi:dipeptidase 1-like [Amphiura filiformis]|uniref:dipeptidase 1-like n=1 Tax=Amphiura filiformis TaxID=82378 RepID=UPI003B210F01
MDGVRHTLDMIDMVKRMCDAYPASFEFVTTSQGIRNAFKNGKIASLIGIEGGHHIGSQLASLRMFYELGARYMTLNHNCNTPWADNWQVDKPDGTPEFDGLTSFGEKVVREMNRLGMLVDLSHTSKATMLDVLNLPNIPPVIYSHTAAFSLCAYHRNVQDDVLNKVKENGGVVNVGFYTQYLNCPPNNVSDDRSFAVLGQVADHIEHIRNVCGIQCVGLGSDFDGADTVPIGLGDVSQFPNLIADLIERGWQQSDIKALLGENLLRVLERVEKYAADAKANNIQPDDTTIPRDELKDTECRTFIYDP